jgi:cytochrome P450
LKRDRNFGVPYLAKMEQLHAPFVLGLDDSPDYRRQRASVKAAVDKGDLDELAQTTRREAERTLAGGGGRIEIVHGLTDPVLGATIGAFLGVGPVSRMQLVQARTVFRDVFINALEDPRVSERAHLAALALRAHVQSVVDDRRAEVSRGVAPRQDVLGRLMQAERAGLPLRLMGEEVVNQVLGLLVAWATSVSRSMGFAVESLLRRPEAMNMAQEAARRQDRDAMAAVLMEAFRFYPPVPGLERVCRRETAIRDRQVPREKDVVIVVASAMVDESVIDDPGRFCPGRAREQDLNFGLARHACLGREIARTQMTEIALALFRRPNVQSSGKLKLEGPYPRRLEVTFDDGAP